MNFLPILKLSILNGWLPLIGFYIPFGLLMWIFPRDVVRKLYDRTGWYQKHVFAIFGRIVTFLVLILLIFSPLSVNSIVFIPGLILYSTGLIIEFVALFNFRNTPVGEPVEQGLYRISRNPQWVGLALITLGSILMTASWLLLLMYLVTITAYHFRILGEEEACLGRYGDSYQHYLDKVPRYFVFF